jgi:hypothetical protein
MLAHEWMQLPIEVRNQLVEKYKLIKTGSTDVRGNEVFSDGYTNEDLVKVEYLIDNKINVNDKTKESEQDRTRVGSGVNCKEAKTTNKRKTVSVSTK